MKKPGKIIKVVWSPFGFLGLMLSSMVVFAIVFFPLVDGKSPRPDLGPSIEDFRTLFIAKMDEELASPENFIRKKIENAHWTVKTTSARVSACSVYSVDGTDRAGRDYSNVGDIDFIVTAFWDGVIQKGGYTEVRMVIDAKSGQTKSSAFVGGNAAFNAEKIDWFAVGETVAPIVVGLVTGGG